MSVGLFLLRRDAGKMATGGGANVQVLNGNSKRWATAYCTISDRELMPIFCMMRVLCVLTVLTLKCRLLAIP